MRGTSLSLFKRRSLQKHPSVKWHVLLSDDPSAITKVCLTMDVLRVKMPLWLAPLVHSLPVFIANKFN